MFAHLSLLALSLLGAPFEAPNDSDFMPFLFGAYTAIWVLIFLYVHVLSRRNRRMEQEIEELRDLLGRQNR